MVIITEKGRKAAGLRAELGHQRIAVSSLQFQGTAYNQLLKPLMHGKYGDIPRETLLEGPTGTGKSMVLGGFTRLYARRFPKANILVLRKVKADLGGSFMKMWENEILDPKDPWDMSMLAPHGAIPSYRSRDYYRYPNGAQIWCRGMDQWARVKSMAYDFIWMMEGTEFEKEHLEGLWTRVRKRRGVDVGWRGIISDVNPEQPKHWWNERANDGDCTRVKTTLRDNPGFYDLNAGVYTEAGQEYISDLRSQLHGHMAQRYIDGEWVDATGTILPFAPNTHVFNGTLRQRPGELDRIEFPVTHPTLGDFVEIKGYAASYDWGVRHAGTLQVWGIDAENRQYLMEEVYHSGRGIEWWAGWAVTMWKRWNLQKIVCDSAAIDMIQHFNRELQKAGGAKARIARPCVKRSGNKMQSNLEVLHAAFSIQPDGKPKVFIKENALVHAKDPDKDIKAKCLADEIPAYIYAPYDPGKRVGRPEEHAAKNCTDDGLDACCYMRVDLDGGRSVATKVRPKVKVTDEIELIKERAWERTMQRRGE